MKHMMYTTQARASPTVRIRMLSYTACLVGCRDAHIKASAVCAFVYLDPIRGGDVPHICVALRRLKRSTSEQECASRKRARGYYGLTAFVGVTACAFGIRLGIREVVCMPVFYPTHFLETTWCCKLTHV